MIANRFIHLQNFHENTPSTPVYHTPISPTPAAHPHSLQSTITNQPWKSHNLATGGKTSDHRDKFSGLAHSPTATYETRARKGSSRDNQGCEMNYDDGCKSRILRRRQVPERNRKIHSGSHLDAVGKKRVTVVYDAQDTQRNLCRHHQQRCADGGSWQYMQNTPVLSA